MNTGDEERQRITMREQRADARTEGAPISAAPACRI